MNITTFSFFYIPTLKISERTVFEDITLCTVGAVGRGRGEWCSRLGRQGPRDVKLGGRM